MIHLMELPNPDTLDMDKRPQHGGRDRHFCIGAHTQFLTNVQTLFPQHIVQVLPAELHLLIKTDLRMPTGKTVLEAGNNSVF